MIEPIVARELVICALRRISGLNRDIPNALMRTLPVVMLDILINEICQPPPAEGDHLIETLLSDRTDKAHRVRVQVRAPRREPDRSDTSDLDPTCQ